MSGKQFQTADDFKTWMADFESKGGYKRPQAYAVGVATTVGEQYLEVFYEVPNSNGNYGTAAVLASIAGYESGNEFYMLSLSQVEEALDMLKVFEHDGGKHPNIYALFHIARLHANKQIVVSFIGDAARAPTTVADAYLRLHLLSHRLTKPNSMNLDGIFGVLPTVAWTSRGAKTPDEAQRIHAERDPSFKIYSVDKFPAMLDYVVPSGVRIADGARVRLGAYLSEGTTVMHEGFCNFNAGTLGKAMIEGRISQGVVIGDRSDLGGSASTMGTLSGGGKEKIVIGRNTLIGANAGTGISLGDNCRIDAGLYITGGQNVGYKGQSRKAYEFSGKDNLRFKRVDGQIIVTEEGNNAPLNDALHKI